MPGQRRCADDSAFENVLYALETGRASRELDETLQAFCQRAAASGWEIICFPHNYFLYSYFSLLLSPCT